jgi:hypothetical protein
MYDFSWLDTSAGMVFYIMVSIGFVIGIILMVAPEAFEKFNNVLKQEYGFKFRFFKKIEDTQIEHIDRFATKNSVIIGMILSVITFILLIIYK